MKTLFFTLLFATVTSLSASVNPIDLVIQTDPTTHTLTLRTTTSVEHPTTVKLVDGRGMVLHTAKLKEGDFLNTRFQLSALPSGTYAVEITDELGKTTQPLLLDREGITSDPALATRTYYPTVNLNDKLLTINYLNTTGHSVNIRLVDAKGHEVITDRLTAGPTVQRAYSLKNLPAGEYYVTVTSRDVPYYTTSLKLD